MSCPECYGSVNRTGAVVHLRSCSRAFSVASRLPWPVELIPDPPASVRPSRAPASLTGTTRPLASLRSQIERESALRRAIAGACPRISYQLISAMVERCVTLDLELEAKGESER